MRTLIKFLKRIIRKINLKYFINLVVHYLKNKNIAVQIKIKKGTSLQQVVPKYKICIKFLYLM